MVKILRNRSTVALIVCAVVLAALVVLATLEQQAKNKVIRQTPSVENIKLLQKAMIEKDDKVCDEIKGDTRRDEIDLKDNEAVFEKDVEVVSEAEAQKRCREGVMQVIEMSKNPQRPQ